MGNEKFRKVLQSERLILRPFEMSDAVDIYRAWGTDEDVARYVTWSTHTCIEDSYAFVSHVLDNFERKEYMVWLVVLKETAKPIGAICLFKSKEPHTYGKWGIGYNYAKMYWHKGFGSEALDTVLRFVFMETDIPLLFAEHSTKNPNSGRVMKHCGMRLKRKTEDAMPAQFGECALYEIEKLEWLYREVQRTMPEILLDSGIRIRGMQEKNFYAYAEMFQDKEVIRYMKETVKTEEKEIKQKLSTMLMDNIKGGYGLFEMYRIETDSESEEFLGTISYRVHKDEETVAHISYCMPRKHWNKGYMTSAVKAVIDYVFTQAPQVYYIESSHAHPNKASGRVMEKAGMRCKGIQRNNPVKCVGGSFDRVRYCINRVEWDKKQKKGVATGERNAIG